MLLLAALVGFVYFYEIRGADERYRARVEAGRLLHLEEDAVSGLTVHAGAIQPSSCRKSGDTWRILQPVATGGDDGEIVGLIRTLVVHGPGAQLWRTASVSRGARPVSRISASTNRIWRWK